LSLHFPPVVAKGTSFGSVFAKQIFLKNAKLIFLKEAKVGPLQQRSLLA
jgi:hypothetical protein